ncbi:MAG: hypothetical protein RMJ44_11840 [Cytophagales bacterium]|nr:hypothetical protein [Bernardetiaceae bacterium]MDW8211766.1 hypothetical protein [Cytophagales bacterium]
MKQIAYLVVIFLVNLFALPVQGQQKPSGEGEANAGKEKTIVFNLRQDGDQQMTCLLSQDFNYTFELELPEESKAQRIVMKLYDSDMNELASSTTVLKGSVRPSLRYAPKKSGLYLLKAFPFAK